MIRETWTLQKYNLEVTEVVSENPSKQKNFDNLTEAFVGDGTIINSGFLNGLKVDEAKIKIIKEIEKIKIGRKKITQTKRLGYFKTKILGLSYPNDTFG